MGDYSRGKITSSLDRDQQSHEKGNQLGEVKHSEMLAEFGLIGCDGGRSIGQEFSVLLLHCKSKRSELSIISENLHDAFRYPCYVRLRSCGDFSQTIFTLWFGMYS